MRVLPHLPLLCCVSCLPSRILPATTCPRQPSFPYRVSPFPRPSNCLLTYINDHLLCLAARYAGTIKLTAGASLHFLLQVGHACRLVGATPLGVTPQAGNSSLSVASAFCPMFGPSGIRMYAFCLKMHKLRIGCPSFLLHLFNPAPYAATSTVAGGPTNIFYYMWLVKSHWPQAQ